MPENQSYEIALQKTNNFQMECSIWFIVLNYVGIVAQTDVTIAFIFFNKVGENNAGH
jgi:hypothetical protein